MSRIGDAMRKADQASDHQPSEFGSEGGWLSGDGTASPAGLSADHDRMHPDIFQDLTDTPSAATVGESAVNAEVLDISAGGAVISTSADAVPGQRGQLRTLLDREPFTASVEVLRVEEGTRDGHVSRNRVGLSFWNLDENSRRTLQRFVKNDPKAR